MTPRNLFRLPILMEGIRQRVLGCLPPHEDFGALPKFAAANPIIPRSQWQTVLRRALFPAEEWILDQGEIGSCVGNGAAAALRKTRYLAGQTDEALSPGCLYAQINGGADNGAVISDALAALQKAGTCLYSTVGETPYLLPSLPANWEQEAKRFRVAQAYHCQSFDEICSAVQLGFPVVFGIMVGDGFLQFDPNGVAGWTAGPGNHCMHADGLTRLRDGRWVLDVCNSWGPRWGPFGNGRVFLCEDHFGHGDQPDAFVILSAINDPSEEALPQAT